MLPATLPLIGILGHDSTDPLIIPKTREQNGSSTYRYLDDTGTEVEINVKHATEKRTAFGQYERHNFDIKLTIFNSENTSNPEEVHQAYLVMRRKRGTSPETVQEVAGALANLMSWILPQLVGGES